MYILLPFLASYPSLPSLHCLSNSLCGTVAPPTTSIIFILPQGKGELQSIFMAATGRAFRKTIRTLIYRKPPNTHHGIPCIHHFEDSTLPLHSCFVQKHAPYFLHQRQLAQVTSSPSQSQLRSLILQGYHLGNNVSTDNFIQGRQHLPLPQPPPNLKYPFPTEDTTPAPAPAPAPSSSRCVHLGTAKTKLRGISGARISYKQLLDLCINCTENACEDESRDIINSLEQSGDIIIIGQTVYLHPEQVTRAVEDALSLSSDHCSRLNEFKILEKEKTAIDMESEKKVRKEMYCGLGFFSLQTAALFWLTYWEFSWDIMEPVSFYLSSAYICLGYVFSLNTKMDLSFESFYAARLKSKQKKLMKIRNFDSARYAELRKICRPALKAGDSDKLI